jgi:hypothetical protein
MGQNPSSFVFSVAGPRQYLSVRKTFTSSSTLRLFGKCDNIYDQRLSSLALAAWCAVQRKRHDCLRILRSIWGSHSGDYEEYSLLGCDDVYVGGSSTWLTLRTWTFLQNVRSEFESRWGKIFSSPRRPDRFWGTPSLLSNGYRGLFPRG